MLDLHITPIFSPPRHDSPCWNKAFLLLRLHDHIKTHLGLRYSSGRMTIQAQGPLPDNTQQ